MNLSISIGQLPDTRTLPKECVRVRPDFLPCPDIRTLRICPCPSECPANNAELIEGRKNQRLQRLMGPPAVGPSEGSPRLAIPPTKPTKSSQAGKVTTYE